MKSFHKLCFFVPVTLFILLGIYLRIRAYLFNTSLWLDECCLFSNVLLKGYSELFRGLSGNQSAPPLFLATEKFIIYNYGIKEQVTRLFPFACSVFALPVFYYFSKTFLKKIPVLIAIFLFAVNYELIFYGQQMKQYSSDVLCFMLLFIFLNKLTIKNLKTKHLVLYSILIILPPLLSIPSYFIIGAWFIRELITSKKDYLKLIAAHIPLCVMSVFYCLYAMIPQYKEILGTYLMASGQQGFLSLDIVKNVKLLADNFRFFFMPCDYTVFYIILACIGIFILLKHYKQKENLLLLLTIIISFVFSAAKIYPLWERVCLYFVPVLIVLMTKVIDIIANNKKLLLSTVIVFILLFNKYNVNYFRGGFLPKMKSNARELMQILITRYNPKYTIVRSVGSYSEYKYYELYYHFVAGKEIFIPFTELNHNTYSSYLDKIVEPNKTYVFFYSMDMSHWEIKILKEWKKDKNVIYEKTLYNGAGNSYILFLKT